MVREMQLQMRKKCCFSIFNMRSQEYVTSKRILTFQAILHRNENAKTHLCSETICCALIHLILSLGIPCMDEACQFGWTYNGSSFYHISINENTWNTSRSYCRMRGSWNEGRQDCIERGADLVVINSREEQKLTVCKEAWIGLTDREKEGTWKWVDGRELTTRHWRKHQPNNNGDQDCAVTSFRNDNCSGWNDLSCLENKYWICEKKAPPSDQIIHID
uniref:C-type lectin domain-containing protein n=1 Tax=Pygocentrus nattereri TaxID=42514 RepID=A0AAR2L6W6_PYGNA